MLQTAQSAAEVAANDVMAEEEQVAAKAAAKKAKKQKQKAKKQRALQQASSETGLLTTEAMSTSIDLGQQESQAAAEQPHYASAACVKETSCIGTAAAGSAIFTAGVSHQVASRATHTQAPNPQPAKPVSTLLADSHFHSPGAMSNSAGRQAGAGDELVQDANAATSCSHPVLHDCPDSVHDLSTLPADRTRLPNQWPASSDHTSSLNSSSPKPHVQSVKHTAASVTTQVVTASVQYDPVAKPSEQGQRVNAGLLLCCPMTKVSPGQALKPCGSLTCMSSFHLQSSSMHDMTYCYAAE